MYDSNMIRFEIGKQVLYYSVQFDDYVEIKNGEINRALISIIFYEIPKKISASAISNCTVGYIDCWDEIEQYSAKKNENSRKKNERRKGIPVCILSHIDTFRVYYFFT